MKIGEVAKRSGVASSTIRFYEEQGLLPHVVRGANGYREYAESDVEQLRLVRHAQKLGFSLELIRGMFLPSGECSKLKVLEQVLIRLREVDALAEVIAGQRRELIALRDVLENGVGDDACTGAGSCGLQSGDKLAA